MLAFKSLLTRVLKKTAKKNFLIILYTCVTVNHLQEWSQDSVDSEVSLSTFPQPISHPLHLSDAAFIDLQRV